MLLAPAARSTFRRIGVHAVNKFSDFLGDDVVSRRARHALLRFAGARLAPSASLHGGTHFSRPSNLSVGERAFVNRGCYLDLEAPIRLDDDVVVGHGTTIITSSHAIGPSCRRAQQVTGCPVAVHRGAWIGAGCTILPGVTVGAGAVVATGAIVTRDVPPNVLVAGIPARFLRELPVESTRP